jgi:hypothetical protein
VAFGCGTRSIHKARNQHNALGGQAPQAQESTRARARASRAQLGWMRGKILISAARVGARGG